VNKTATITRHEFITTVRRRMYLIFTLALPLIAVIIMLGGQALGGAPGPPARAEQIGYVDMAGVVTGFNAQGNVSFVPYTSQAEANAALLDGRVESYIVIPAGYISTGLVQRFTTSRELDKGAAIQSATASFLVENLLNGKTGPDIITRVQAPVSLTSTLLTATGEVAPNQGAGSFLVPYFFSLLLLMSIFFSSSYLLQGLGEEKENRVMEILLSSVSARQLLAGKTLGLGAAGLLQILVWLFSARFLASYASGTFGAAIGQISIPPGLIVIGVIYFVLGYLLFAVLMAGVGAITPTAREGQQMSALFSIAAVIPIFFMTVIIEHPEGVVPLVLSYIPLTAPITMIMRAGSMSIPAWQVAVSAAILMATIAGCFVLAAKLFRTFLLMYGKRAELKDILRSFRSA
jgi:ABC-2 type transport system permease protein